MSATEAAGGGTAIREFHVAFAESDLAELRRRIDATRWPQRETVGDDSQGVPLATMQELARHWATEYDWLKVRGAAERPPAVHDPDRWAGHPFRSCPFEARGRTAARRLPRLAGLALRAAQAHRPAHRSHRAWRERVRRVPPGDPVDARGTDSPASRPTPAGIRCISARRTSSSCGALGTRASSRRAATGVGSSSM